MSQPQTITQKILAAHCGKDYVEPGELIMARVDIALGNDITAPLAIKDFHKVGAKHVYDRSRVVLVCDHFAPNKDIASAVHCQQLRHFAREQDLRHFYEGGDMGIEHALLPEQVDDLVRLAVVAHAAAPRQALVRHDDLHLFHAPERFEAAAPHVERPFFVERLAVRWHEP